jgi:hypothetical protein
MSNALLVSVQETFNECEKLCSLKNQDYAGDGNPFKNFELSRIVGVSPERAILVRLTDKLSRISNLLDRKEVVLDEKITDTINDAIVYLAILKAYLENK